MPAPPEGGSSKNLPKESQPENAARAVLRGGESSGFLSQNTWFRVRICHSLAEGCGACYLSSLCLNLLIFKICRDMYTHAHARVCARTHTHAHIYM